MKNKGKVFEQDFQNSCKSQLDLTRLKDPSSSFNIACAGCKKQVTRFSPQNICDFIGYKYPNMFLFELKSCAGTSIPFKNIVKNNKDKRLQDMAHKSEKKGIKAYVIFNWRAVQDVTYAVSAIKVKMYINAAERKSIPMDWTIEEGIKLLAQKKITRYSYDLSDLIITETDNNYDDLFAWKC